MEQKTEEIMSVDTCTMAKAKGIDAYLIGLVSNDGVNTIAKVAALSVLKDILDKEMDSGLKDKCLHENFITTLMTILDTGLLEKENPSYVIYTTVASEILFTLSKQPVCSINSLISELVIGKLLEYVSPSCSFYVFPADIREQLSSLCANKHMVGKVKAVTMASEPLEYIHQHTNNKLKR